MREGPFWTDRAARFVEPDNIDGNMGIRARLWRGFCDWGWGLALGTSRWERCRWFVGRLFQ